MIGAGTNSGYTFTSESTGTTVGATTNPLGEYVHTLSVTEMPSHSHTRGTMNIVGSILIRRAAASDGDKSLADGATDAFSLSPGTGTSWSWKGPSLANSSHKTDVLKFNASNGWEGETSSVGGSQTHNNIQPYIVTYIWKRTS